MQPKIMITNGGPHPAEKWAELSASEIIVIAEGADSDSARAGRRLELKFIDIFEEYHKQVQAAERAHLDADGDGRLESPLDGKEHDPEEVVAACVEAAKGTPFEAHFLREDVQNRIRTVATHHAALSMDVERSWHADRSDSEAAQTWKKDRTELGLGLAHKTLVEQAEAKTVKEPVAPPTK